MTSNVIMSGKSSWTQIVCSDFLYKIFFKIFLIVRRTERDRIQNVYCPSCEIHSLYLSDFNYFNFNKLFSKNSSNIKFHENPSNGNTVVQLNQFYFKHIMLHDL